MAEKEDLKRRSMSELFRARLMNNKGSDKLSKLSQDVKSRETWNYKVQYDGQEAYCPPNHVPILPTKEA